MKKKNCFAWVTGLVCVLLVAGCSTTDPTVTTASPTQTHTAQAPVSTQASTAIIPTPTPLATEPPIPSATLTATITVTPHPGFSSRFKFYQAWTKGGKTYFYFMNAGVPEMVFATIDDLNGNVYEMDCPLDETYPNDLRCFSEHEILGQSVYNVAFFGDQARQHKFYEAEVKTTLDTRYLTYDNCESEYRIYDGKCYSAITCYDDFGTVIYTFDNIPYDGNFEGFSIPCP